MRDLLKKGATLIVLGTGGVGKTTIAASLGVVAARAGLKTAVITVDPSRRLRDALGLDHLGGRPTALGARRLAAAGLDPSLQFFAMVLDVKGAWDALIERFTTDSALRERILNNPFYRQLTSQFAGSEAYAALAQLHDVHSRGDFDLIVVDTPPAADAFEFLQAPAHLSRLLDSRVARWLFTPYVSAGRLAMRLASGAARFVVRELERFAGATVLTSISDFFTAAQQALDGMVDQLNKAEALLHSGTVSFLLVTGSEEERLREAGATIEQMKAQRLRLSAIVINRLVDEETWQYLHGSARGTAPGLDAIANLRGALGRGLDRHHGLDALVKYLENYRARAYRDIARAGAFAQALPPGVRLAVTPEVRAGVIGLKQLAGFGRYLEGCEIKPARLRSVQSWETGVSL